jgi:hypothetical protein
MTSATPHPRRRKNPARLSRTKSCAALALPVMSCRHRLRHSLTSISAPTASSRCGWRDRRRMTTRPQKTLGEMRASGARGLLIYCADYQCSHSIRINADQWPDETRLSDLEERFVCSACGKRGADCLPKRPRTTALWC